MTYVQYVNRYRNVVLDDPQDDDLFVCFGNSEHTMIVDDEEDGNVVIKCVSCKYRKTVGATTLDTIKKKVDGWDAEHG